MSTATCPSESEWPCGHFELRFSSLATEGRGYAFPCDARGQVDLDGLSDSLRSRYLYVRALVGRDFLSPAVQARVAV
ncbi:hypothetical protein BurJ1DRAFT_2613 [Burkholderiales bacterium JOSHI_001]|nr:hypothetical protein BurJ1DRAFT_2613 [Burkholderiales bacterium JOSHI_001]